MANEFAATQLTDDLKTAKGFLSDAKGVLVEVRDYAISIKALIEAIRPVTVTNFPASVPVTGTFWPATQPVNGTVTVGNFPATQAVTLGAISLGVSAGKTNALKTDSLTTTATTADQVVLTYTVTAGKTLYLEYLAVIARLTALSATASILGAWSLEAPSGTKVFTWTCTNPTTSLLTPFFLPFAEPMSIPAGVTVRVVTTPANTTSMLWLANFGGYEK